MAAAEGRLNTEELEERLAAAFGARTAAELSELVGDLPGVERRPPGGAPRRLPGGRRGRSRSPERQAFLATSLLLVAIWALTGAGYFWPVWPILGWGVFVLGPAAGTRGAARAAAGARRGGAS